MDSEATSAGEAAPAPAANQQTAGTTPASGTTPAAKVPPWYMNPLVWILAIVWIWLIRSWSKQKKQQDSRKQELEGVKKGDKVVTIGRLHGVVTSTDDTTVTLKPDDKSNVLLTFDKVAIHSVNRDEKSESGDKKD